MLAALQPAHGHQRRACIDLAMLAPVDDPRLTAVRGLLICCSSGQQDGLPDLKGGTDFTRGAEQLNHQGICVHETLPSRGSFAFGMGCRPRRTEPM